jgi:hypothetical protein
MVASRMFGSLPFFLGRQYFGSVNAQGVVDKLMRSFLLPG